MKNKTFIDSLKCAFKGLFYAFKTEKNYKYYICIALVFLIINIVLKVSLVFNIGYVITAVGVFSSECINTAIEHLADLYSTEIKTEIKLVKDIAAAAVLFWGFAFFIVEFWGIGYSLCG